METDEADGCVTELVIKEGKLPESIESPFKWNVHVVNTHESSEEIISRLLEKDEEIINDTDFAWRSFIMQLVICYEYDRQCNLKESITKIRECELILKSKDESCINSFYKSISKALWHVTLACKAYLMLKSDLATEAEQALQAIMPAESMDKPNQAGIYGIKAAVLMEYGFAGCNAAVEVAKEAVEKDPKQPEWHFLLGKSISSSRRVYSCYDKIPDGEIKAMKEAVHLATLNSWKPLRYLVYLANVYREYAFRTYKSNVFDKTYAHSNTAQLVNTLDNKARDIYRTVMQLSPNNSRLIARCCFGLLKLPTHIPDCAMIDSGIQKALSLSPNNAMILHVTGMFYDRCLEDFDNAKKYYTMSAKLGCYGAWNNLIKLKYCSLMDYNPMDDFVELLENSRSTPRRHQTLCQMGAYQLIQKRDLPRAIQYLMKVYKENPDSYSIKILSRMKPAVGAASTSEQQNTNKQIPTLEDFLEKRDYTGAITVLEFDQNSGKGTDMTDQWLGYCAFHLGDYKRALNIYQALGHSKAVPEDIHVNLACCYFFLGMYPQSEAALEKAANNRLKTRLMFHLAHKLGDEKKLMEHHQQLQDIIEDQLSLASIHYLRSHYQEAIDIYKRILLDNREYLALNVYVALCYYKLDYYDVSQEVLAVYLQKYPDSVIAINLKACNHFRLYNGKAAETEIKTLMDQSSSTFNFGHDLIRHNMVVFRGGVGALQVLPPLVDVIPEARLNLVIYHLKQEEYQEAYMLVKDLEPSVPQEYILKGVVNVAIGQENGTRDHIKVAQQFFQLVGSSASECDTIPGRQCMASSFFLQRQFDDVQLFLSSIKSYYLNDDSFNFNYAQSKAALGQFKEAEETFLMIQNEKLHNDYVYISHLAHCYVMNGKPQSAWELYLKMETSADSFSLLQVLANDCYRMGHFWHAAKAFDMLERLDPNPEYWEGKRGACAGVFQLIIAGKQPKELLSDVIQLLRNTANSQVETIIRTMKKWAKDNRINV